MQLYFRLGVIQDYNNTIFIDHALFIVTKHISATYNRFHRLPLAEFATKWFPGLHHFIVVAESYSKFKLKYLNNSSKLFFFIHLIFVNRFYVHESPFPMAYGPFHLFLESPRDRLLCRTIGIECHTTIFIFHFYYRH